MVGARMIGLLLLMGSLLVGGSTLKSHQESNEFKGTLRHGSEVLIDEEPYWTYDGRKMLRRKRRNSKEKLTLMKCGHHVKGKLNECEQNIGSLVGNMPFISDYRRPRTHPPRNN